VTRCAEERALGAEAVNQRLALAGHLAHQAVRAGDTDAVDGLGSERLPAGGDGGHLGELVAHPAAERR
jgi:hypothetical protein